MGIVLISDKDADTVKTPDSTAGKVLGLFMWSWFFGQLILWCVFQPIAVEEILRKKLFDAVVREYSAAVIILALISCALTATKIVLARKIKSFAQNKSERKSENDSEHAVESSTYGDRSIKVFWIIFFVILAVQIVLQAILAYMEVDDSFYVSEAVEAGSSGYMYMKIPYTGYTTGFDMRHSLEPFPIWLAYIARVTGMNTTVLAQTLLPVLLLPLTYGVYALVGSRLLGRNKKYLPIFMVFTEILVLFGYYSTRTPEKFFITRIRQGKSALSSLVIPGIILCLLVILQYIKENKKVDFRLWIMLFCLNMSGCLCSTLGAVLCMLPVIITAFLIVIMYKKWRHLPGMLVSCLPSLFFAFLYLILG